MSELVLTMRDGTVVRRWASRHDLFDEALHPRDDAGKFTDSGSVGPSKADAFARAAALEVDQRKAADRIKESVSGRVSIMTNFPTINPQLTAAANTVADVLAEMKEQGLEMPHHVNIIEIPSEQLQKEGNRGVRAQIETYTERDGAGNLIHETKDLVVMIPATIPADVDLDDAVAAVFSEKVPSTHAQMGRINDTVKLTPEEKAEVRAHPDPLHPTYDRFTAHTLRDVIVHEIGHVQAGHREELNVEARVGPGKLFPTVLDLRRAMLRVSTYAATNANEFLAESFTRLYRGETLDEDSMKLYRSLDGPPLGWDREFGVKQ